jgi:hypothetical protein
MLRRTSPHCSVDLGIFVCVYISHELCHSLGVYNHLESQASTHVNESF